MRTDGHCDRFPLPLRPRLYLERPKAIATTKSEVNKGNEVCDGLDNDCNGTTDDDNSEGYLSYLDAMATDGYRGSRFVAARFAAPYTATRIGDCNDGNGASPR